MGTLLVSLSSLHLSPGKTGRDKSLSLPLKMCLLVGLITEAIGPLLGLSRFNAKGGKAFDDWMRVAASYCPESRLVVS